MKEVIVVSSGFCVAVKGMASATPETTVADRFVVFINMALSFFDQQDYRKTILKLRNA